MVTLLLRRRFGANTLTGDDENFDGGTVGNWLTSGTNTLAATTDQARSPTYSSKATYKDHVVLGRLSGVTMPSAGKYRLEAFVYIPAGWDGGGIRTEFTNYAGSTSLKVVRSSLNAETDAWTMIYSERLIVAGDLSGILRILTDGAPSADKFIYIDDVKVRKLG